jgi:hypothetical protein
MTTRKQEHLHPELENFTAHEASEITKSIILAIDVTFHLAEIKKAAESGKLSIDLKLNEMEKLELNGKRHFHLEKSTSSGLTKITWYKEN